MLSQYMLQEQTFDNLMAEARNQIPLYTKEWTNFNPSDPAETILENMSAFSILQQAYIDRMPEEAQEKMFAMAGFKKESGKSARVLLEAKHVKEPVLLPAGQRFQVGELFFETNKEYPLRGNHLIGVFAKYQNEIFDYSYLLDEEYPMDAEIFTKEPKAGMELYFVMDGVPAAGEDMIFYAALAGAHKRNAFHGKNLFADMEWQLYTEHGFRKIRCKDGSGCFLSSGELSFRMPKEEAEVYEELPKRGFVIRGILKRAEYDIPPKLSAIYGFLFEVWQKETKSICYTYGHTQMIDMFCDIIEAGYMRIYVKEKADGSYYLYRQAEGEPKKGRYYRIERTGYGMFHIEFDANTFGYAPGHFDNVIKIVSYKEEIMRSYDLGILYGYDAQEMALPVENIVKESFSVIVQHTDADGETVYDFIRPSSEKAGEFQYTLLEHEGKIRIEEAADFIGCKLMLGGCAISNGFEGNVRKGNVFKPLGYDTEVVFVNPAAGKGGLYPETLEDVRNRMILDLRTHYTAVEAEDYEYLVKTTPELCIDKVKAIWDEKSNQVQITVKPVSRMKHPTLSKIYQDAIRKRLEQARLLTVRINIQQPMYVPVHVRGTIYVKPHYEGSREKIEALIRKELDYISTERNFGERFHFEELFHKIESLSCVKYIFELSVASQNMLYAPQKGLDILPKDCCLLYPGEIQLELNTIE